MLQTKLSVFYFAYFALLGVTAPYLGLFLDSEGFSATQIGQLTGLMMMTKVVAPNVWGYVADISQKRLLLVRFGAMMTLVSFFGFFLADGFWFYACMIVMFSFFWNAILAQFEVITLHNLAGQTQRYSLIRLWGSIGFVAAVLVLGWLSETFGIQVFPAFLLFVIISIFFASLFHFEEPGSTQQSESEQTASLFSELKRGRAYLFFVVSFLLQVSHGAYYSYYSLYLEQLGYDKLEIGMLWALGVIAEIVLFTVMHRWHVKHSVKTIMSIALFLSAIRWLLIAQYSQLILVLIFAQILHAFSFGAMHAASIHFVHRHFSQRCQGRAQAMYSSLGFGLGGSLGALWMASLVKDTGYAFLFALSSMVAASALAFVWLLRTPR